MITMKDDPKADQQAAGETTCGEQVFAAGRGLEEEPDPFAPPTLPPMVRSSIH